MYKETAVIIEFFEDAEYGIILCNAHNFRKKTINLNKEYNIVESEAAYFYCPNNLCKLEIVKIVYYSNFDGSTAFWNPNDIALLLVKSNEKRLEKQKINCAEFTNKEKSNI